MVTILLGRAVRASEFSMTLVDGFKMLMGSDKNLLPLVVEIGALNDMLEIFQRIFFATRTSPNAGGPFLDPPSG